MGYFNKAMLVASAALCFNLSTFAQDISLKISDVTVKEAMEQLKNASGYSFVFSSNDINTKQRVSVSAEDATIEEVVKQILKGQTGIDYEIQGKKIILKKKSSSSTSQQKSGKVTGRVLDAKGEPIIGATIMEKGTSNGTITDFDGNFILEVSDGAPIEISYIGYQTQLLSADINKLMSVTLKEDTKVLEEVVVVGFATQKKANLTGAVSQVSMDKVLGDRPVTSLGAALQGAMPGFTASSSAIPGAGNTFNIRGLESINGGSPLILVDNVVYNDLYLLNPADIESVSVLKDASSAAIYGARASFGVVLITTKKGKKNESLSINYNNNFATSHVTNLLKPASPIETLEALQAGGYSSLWSGQHLDTWMELLNDYKMNPSKYPLGWQEVNGVKYFLRENDVYGDMFENSWQQTHNVSAQGGSEKINYRLSASYSNQNGILVTDKDSFERINVKSSVTGDITKWLSTSLDVSYSKGTKTYPKVDGSSEIANLWKSNMPSWHPVGYLPYSDTEDQYPVMTPENVIRLTNVEQTVTDNTRLLSRTVLKPLKGLEAVLEYSYQVGQSDYESYCNRFTVHQGLAESLKPSTSTNPFTRNTSSTRYSTLNAFVTYNNSLKEKHNISAILGYNQEKNDYRYMQAIAYNQVNNDLPFLGGTDGVTPHKVSDSYNQYALRSGFLRASYNYMQKYFIELNGRYDLSSKFPRNYRGGLFPSVSAAWTLSNENFWEKMKTILSTFKLRASYGTLGNQNIGNYGYFATMGVESANWIIDGMRPTTIGVPGMVRANYTWEKVTTYNLGLDFGILSDRLSGTFEVYRRNTLGMLGPSEDLPAVGGATAPMQNAADMKTNGWELSLNWRDRIGEVSYGIGGNLYDSRSFITRYKNNNKLLNTYYEGQEVGELWGYLTDGFYTADDFNSDGTLKDGVVSINGVNSHVGDIKYKNLRDDEDYVNVITSGDGSLSNPGDKVIIGNNRPRFQYGINGYIQWKGFNFSFILQGVGKRDAWIGGDITFPMASQYGILYKHQIGNIWTEDNPDAFYGRIYENAGGSQSANQYMSDKFLYNASYLRVKNITLSYSFPQKWINNLLLKNLKVFVSGEDLFTFDHLPDGIDPENLNWNYPHARTISFGVNLTL